MCRTDEADTGEEENSAQDKIDKYLFHIANSTFCLHKIYCTQYQTGYAQEGQYDANNSFFHPLFC